MSPASNQPKKLKLIIPSCALAVPGSLKALQGTIKPGDRSLSSLATASPDHMPTATPTRRALQSAARNPLARLSSKSTIAVQRPGEIDNARRKTLACGCQASGEENDWCIFFFSTLTVSILTTSHTSHHIYSAYSPIGHRWCTSLPAPKKHYPSAET